VKRKNLAVPKAARTKISRLSFSILSYHASKPL
jgi:hypothetical protein